MSNVTRCIPLPAHIPNENFAVLGGLLGGIVLLALYATALWLMPHVYARVIAASKAKRARERKRQSEHDTTALEAATDGHQHDVGESPAGAPWQAREVDTASSEAAYPTATGTARASQTFQGTTPRWEQWRRAPPVGSEGGAFYTTSHPSFHASSEGGMAWPTPAAPARAPPYTATPSVAHGNGTRSQGEEPYTTSHTTRRRPRESKRALPAPHRASPSSPGSSQDAEEDEEVIGVDGGTHAEASWSSHRQAGRQEEAAFSSPPPPPSPPPEAAIHTPRRRHPPHGEQNAALSGSSLTDEGVNRDPDGDMPRRYARGITIVPPPLGSAVALGAASPDQVTAAADPFSQAEARAPAPPPR